jgi:hypothetical protein
MKFKPLFIRVFTICAGTGLLLPLLFGMHTMSDYLLGVGIAALFISVIVLFSGGLIALGKQSRPLGQAMMLSGAILLLASFTLCSGGGGLF